MNSPALTFFSIVDRRSARHHKKNKAARSLDIVRKQRFCMAADLRTSIRACVVRRVHMRACASARHRSVPRALESRDIQKKRPAPILIRLGHSLSVLGCVDRQWKNNNKQQTANSPAIEKELYRRIVMIDRKKPGSSRAEDESNLKIGPSKVSSRG